ncbi:ABC transporter domain-containing protein [Mycena kentingensis (nom. inval.)]|nr:ABC transporter domain-containing protein [Mycena kentingensis (nom. inval.)]
MSTPEDAPPASGGLILSLPPPKPYSLTINNLTIGAPTSKAPISIPFLKRKKTEAEDGPRTIVRDASGTCGAGEMLAIIGGSGSGKTTMLNAIAGRLHGLPILDGCISFSLAAQSGKHIATPKVSKIIGFTLMFSAALRLPKTVDKRAVREIVEQTIEELGLKECADTVVGGIFRKGISGGERRRLSIGCVLVTMPSVLVLDEPTTGLDATTSFVLLQTLSELAKRHSRTIILSLHAPRSDAFALFDRLMVLTKGNVVYSGRGADSLAWFEEHGCELRQETNPLDFLIDVTSIDNRSPDREEESRTRVAALVQAWRDRPADETEPLPFQQTPITHTISRTSQAAGEPADDSELARPGLFRQTAILLHRSHLNVYRNLGQIAGFLIQSIGIGLFMGLTYYDLQGTPADIQRGCVPNVSRPVFSASRAPAILMMCSQGYYYLTQVYWIYKFCNDLIIFDREREDRLYNTFPYIIAEFIANLVPTTVPPTVYAVIFYLLANMRRDNFAANILMVIANCICMQWATQGMALVAASIFRGFPQASLCANALSLFFTLSAGFSLTIVPVWLRWIKWLSTTFYSFRLVATTQFKDRVFACEGVTGVALSQCDGNNVLRSLKFSIRTPIVVWFAAEIGIIVVLHLLAGVILQFYKPGGVKHAVSSTKDHPGKESIGGDMDIPRAKINVEIRNLGFKWVSSGLPFLRKSESKPILNGISTVFPAGQISAILGPSGAGKSTLLQLLANRKLNAGPNAHFETSGELLYNGRPATSDVRNSVAFVEQEDDYHLSALTVRETLRYAAILRLPAKMSKKRKIARAEEVLLMLGLKDCADVYVGGELLKGISGGEKRRLSLAVQMISDPSILVVDEPTSGLDSFIANNVMQCLKEIAATGRTVIVSIHQPRSDIFHALDNMLILAKGGNAVFSGKRVEAVRIMESQGYPLPSVWFNPADHLLDLVTVDQRAGKSAESRDRVDALVSFWKTYHEKVGAVEGPTKAESSSDSLDTVTAAIPHESRFTPIYIALPVVWERMFRNLWRQREAFGARLTQPPLAAILLLMFYERLRFGPTAGQDRIGVNLQSTGAIPFVGLISGIAVFPQDRQLFMHEYRSSAAYSTATLMLAYSLMEIPFQFAASLLYGVFINVAVGMQTNARIYFEYFSGILSLSVPYWLQIRYHPIPPPPKYGPSNEDERKMKHGGAGRVDIDELAESKAMFNVERD